MLKLGTMGLTLLLATASPAIAQHSAATAAADSAPEQMPRRLSTDPYAPYAFLLGDWYSKEGRSVLRQNFSMRPTSGYMVYSTYLTEPGKPERLHFEGIMVWNAKSNLLDYVFAVEPGSGIQEKGSIRAEADGSVVRDVELTDPAGQVSQFRQTIRRTGEDQMTTALMRRIATGWVPTFPGSDKIVMRRQR